MFSIFTPTGERPLNIGGRPAPQGLAVDAAASMHSLSRPEDTVTQCQEGKAAGDVVAGEQGKRGQTETYIGRRLANIPDEQAHDSAAQQTENDVLHHAATVGDVNERSIDLAP
jgi:hypothetical protein